MSGDSVAPVLTQQLLLSVAEQMKLPLLQIARQAEISRLGNKIDAGALASIEATAEAAIRLLDNYLLGVRLSLEQGTLEIEPVSVSSVLYDAGNQLDSLAKQYGVELELSISTRCGPVMAHRQGLQAALVSLGSSLIEALPALESPQLKLQLAMHRCRYGIVAGLYSDAEQLTSDALRQGRRLSGFARQPFAGLTYTSGAGIFVADAILKAMQLQLRVSRHHRLFGLGAVLQPNYQMQLV